MRYLIMQILQYQELLKNFPHQTFERGEIIFNEGDECDRIGIIESGEIKITTITIQDHEETISYLTSGEIFGNHLIFSSHPFFLGDVICEKKASIIFINKKQLISLLQTNQNFLESYLKAMSDKAIAIKQQQKMMAHKALTDRLLYYLSIQAKRTSSKTINIPSITKLSIELSVPRPSLARIIKRLDDEGIIKYEKHQITLI